MKYFGTETLVTPEFFPILSVGPQRAMLVVKDRHPRDIFEKCFLDTWRYSFITHINIQKPEGLVHLLSKHFDEKEVNEITKLMTTKKYKDMLTQNTNEALGQGAFGAPWFKLTNKDGVVEPLFGSDRWTYMWDFLGVEFEDIKIVDKAKAKAKL